ncbi:MAG: NAD(P)-dependent oxidoreductase [Chloroflexota bacterium]|nr:NAD(P)-dependent oxidoreductase [Chloroflexota bacterium]
MMRILITGAGGNMGSGLTERLGGRHALRLSDVAALETGHEFVRMDVRDREAFVRAAEGVDLIVHTPAWHGIHLRDHSETDFWDLNVAGTFNMFQAAIANRVPRVVWLSSQSVFSRDNIYGLTKVVGEELCGFYHRRHGLRCNILRPADFTPYRNRKHYGERLLRGGVDRRDVVEITALAAENDATELEAFSAMRDDPFTPEDVQRWRDNPETVLEGHVAGAGVLVERYNLDLPEEIAPPDISLAKERLGYKPRYNFVTFLRELAEHDRGGTALEWLAGR